MGTPMLMTDAAGWRGEDLEPSRDARPAGGVAAASLAYLGGLPLLGAALWIVAEGGDDPRLALDLMATYGVAMILFFAGVRWGVAVMRVDGPTLRGLGGAAAPFALALPLLAPFDPMLRMPAIMVAMALLLVDDLATTGRGGGAPAWHLGVRLPLTVLVEVAFAVALAATWA